MRDQFHAGQSQDRSVRRDSALAGIGGILGGWAIFVLWVAERDHLRVFVLALLVASLVALALEHLREVVREGLGELERHSFLSVGITIVLLVITCELFVKASAEVTKMSFEKELVSNLLPSLIGVADFSTKSTMPAPVMLAGLIGIWCFQGMAASQWLAGLVGRPAESEDSQGGEKDLVMRMAVTAGKGALGALYCAAALIVALLAFRLFVMLADPAVFRGVASEFSFLPKILFGVFSLWHMLFGELLKLDERFTVWRGVPAALVMLVFLIFGNRFLTDIRRHKTEPWFEFFTRELNLIGKLLLAGLLLALIGPVVCIAPIILLKQIMLAVIIWVVPCAVLGGLIPLLQRLSRLPGFWLSVALFAASLVFAAVWLRQNLAWPWLAAALLLLAAGVVALFGRGRLQADGTCAWPLFPFFVGLMMCGPVTIREEISSAFLRDTHTLMTVAPPSPTVATIDEFKDGKVFDMKQLSYRPVRLDDLKNATSQANKAMAQFQEAWKNDLPVVKQLVKHDKDRKNENAKQYSAKATEEDSHGGKQSNDEEKHHSVFECVIELQAATSEVQWKHTQLDSLCAIFKNEQHRKTIVFRLQQQMRHDRKSREGPSSLSEKALLGISRGGDAEKPLNLEDSDRKEAEARIDAAISVADSVARKFRADPTQDKIKDVNDKLSKTRRHLSQILELCVSASLGFWTTLACLGTWKRLVPRHCHDSYS